MAGSTFHDAFNATFGNMLRLADMQGQRANESRRLDQADKEAAANEQYRADQLALQRDQLAATEQDRAAQRDISRGNLRLAEQQEARLSATAQLEQTKARREENARLLKQNLTRAQALLDSGDEAGAIALAKESGVLPRLDDLVSSGEAAKTIGAAFSSGDPAALSSPEVAAAQTQIGEALLRNSGRGDKYRDPRFMSTDAFLSGLPDGQRKQALQAAIAEKFGRTGGVIMTFADGNGRRFTATEAQSSDPNAPIRVQSWEDIQGALQTMATAGDQVRGLRDRLAADIAGVGAYLGEKQESKDPYRYEAVEREVDGVKQKGTAVFLRGQHVRTVWGGEGGGAGDAAGSVPATLEAWGVTSAGENKSLVPDSVVADTASRAWENAAMADMAADAYPGMSVADLAQFMQRGETPDGKKIKTADGELLASQHPYKAKELLQTAYSNYANRNVYDRQYAKVLNPLLVNTSATPHALRKWVLGRTETMGAPIKDVVRYAADNWMSEVKVAIEEQERARKASRTRGGATRGWGGGF